MSDNSSPSNSSATPEKKIKSVANDNEDNFSTTRAACSSSYEDVGENNSSQVISSPAADKQLYQDRPSIKIISENAGTSTEDNEKNWLGSLSPGLIGGFRSSQERDPLMQELWLQILLEQQYFGHQKHGPRTPPENEQKRGPRTPPENEQKRGPRTPPEKDNSSNRDFYNTYRGSPKSGYATPRCSPNPEWEGSERHDNRSSDWAENFVYIIDDISKPSCSGLFVKKTKPLSRSSSETNLAESETLDNVCIPGCDYEIKSEKEPFISTAEDVKGKKKKLILTDLLPKTTGKQFKNIGFYITLGNCLLNKSLPNHQFLKTPFERHELELAILQGGGELCENIIDISPGERKFICVIARDPCITPTYILGLSAGVRIYHHSWLRESALKRTRMQSEELPAGWSLEEKRYIKMNERVDVSPFKDIHISIYDGKSPFFFQYWSQVCSNAGAIVSKYNYEQYKKKRSKIVVVEDDVSDDLPEKMLMDSLRHGCPVVSTMWVIQSLIHGKIRQFHAHKYYNPINRDRLKVIEEKNKEREEARYYRNKN